MNQIHSDPRMAGQAARRPLLRRTVLVTSALTAVAAVTAVVGIAVGGDGPVPHGSTTLSGQEILLAAANTAQRQPQDTGTYWYVKTVSRDAANKLTTLSESWDHRDGRSWFRSRKSGDEVVSWPEGVRYTLGAPDVTFQQIQDLPTTPDALRAWITDATNNSDIRNSGGPLSPEMKEKHVFYGLISLVSQLPAPPGVRAAAFQAIAAYPNVTNLGPVDGGQGMRISFGAGSEARLVIDPVAAQVRETDFVVMAGGSLYFAGDGSSIILTAEWTDTLPE